MKVFSLKGGQTLRWRSGLNGALTKAPGFSEVAELNEGPLLKELTV